MAYGAVNGVWCITYVDDGVQQCSEHWSSATPPDEQQGTPYRTNGRMVVEMQEAKLFVLLLQHNEDRVEKVEVFRQVVKEDVVFPCGSLLLPKAKYVWDLHRAKVQRPRPPQHPHQPYKGAGTCRYAKMAHVVRPEGTLVRAGTQCYVRRKQWGGAVRK